MCGVTHPPGFGAITPLPECGRVCHVPGMELWFAIVMFGLLGLAVNDLRVRY